MIRTPASTASFIFRRHAEQKARACLFHRLSKYSHATHRARPIQRETSSYGDATAGEADAINTSPPPSVSLSIDDASGLAILTVSNPTRRNALSADMMDQLDDHVRTLAAWSAPARGGSGGGVDVSSEPKNSEDGASNNARVVVLTGSHGNFCSGLDLRDSGSSILLSNGRAMVERMTRITNLLRSLPVLSVAAIDGHAVGGGAELATATDLRVLSRSAEVRFVHASRGASPGWGGARRLTAVVGRAAALRLLLLGLPVRGDEDARREWRFADAVADEGETAMDAARRMIVDPVLDLPCGASVRAIKSAVAAADGDSDVISSRGELNIDGNLAVRGEIESFVSVWGGSSNQKQIDKAKKALGKKEK